MTLMFYVRTCVRECGGGGEGGGGRGEGGEGFCGVWVRACGYVHVGEGGGGGVGGMGIWEPAKTLNLFINNDISRVDLLYFVPVFVVNQTLFYHPRQNYLS